MKRLLSLIWILIGILTLLLAYATFSERALAADEVEKGRDVIFIGVDISGSFKNSPDYNDSLAFISRYLYAHLKGYSELKPPHSLFVGSIGGTKPDEPKTFYPIQNFEYKEIQGIEDELHRIFKDIKPNQFTDYNTFFKQVTVFVRNKKLSLKPITIILLTDGMPDAPKVEGKLDYRSFNLTPLENLSRNITIRVLYTSAEVGMNWQEKVPRQRVRIWTQDASVMRNWKSKDIMLPDQKFEKQERFFSWIKDNVDFPVRAKRVN
ncbi:MAG: hypothetical protein HQK54_09130 [Oligoflexales bacterium]|nr:hypothetical protein [Oligoflexales bacterium]